MRRRLLVVSPTFWPEPVGTPKYALDAARWFNDQGWAVAVVTAQPFYPEFELYDGWGAHRARDRVEGIPILRMPTIVPRGGTALWRMASDVNFAAQVALRGIQRTIPAPDAVLSFSPGVPFAIAAATAFAGGVPHVSIVHDIQSGLARATGLARGRALDVMERVEARSLDTADHLLALSDAMKQALADIGVRTPVDVAPIWADIDIADRPPSTPGRDGFTVVYSGNLGRKQGIPLLVDVAERLQDLAPDVRMVLRGRGALRGWATEEVASRGLDNVSLEDFVPADRLAESLAEPDLHIVPQVSGSGAFAMPSKVVNILASGRPMLAVCDNDDPLHRAAEDGLGLWAPADSDAVAAVIVRAQGQTLETVASAGLAYVREQHDRNRVLRKVETLLLG